MIEADVSREAFEAFAQPEPGTDSPTWEGVDVRALLDREVEVIDSSGNVSAKAAQITVLSEDVPENWNVRDTVIIDGEEFSIAEQLADDGYLAEFLAHPQ